MPMSSDTPGGGGLTSGAGGQVAGGVLSSYLGAALSRFGVGSQGSGKMAQRGYAQAAQELQRLSILQAQLQQRGDLALRAFEAETPGGVGEVLVFNPDKRVQQLEQGIQQIRQAIDANTNVRKEKKLVQQLQKKEQKLAKRALKTSPQAEVRVAERYGANSGFWAERGAPPPAWLFERG